VKRQTIRELLYDDIAHMRDVEGLTWRAIGERVGISLRLACEYYHDPTGERARERKMVAARKCVDCGAPCNTDGSVTNPAVRCLPCAAKHTGAQRKVWTREAIIAAISEWAAIHGEPPRSLDWHPNASRHQRAAHPDYLSQPNLWPSRHTVMREFGQPGGWARAIREAGFRQRARGETDEALLKPGRVAQAVELYRTGLTQAEVARALGLSTTAVWRYLRDAGEPARPRGRRKVAA